MFIFEWDGGTVGRWDSGTVGERADRGDVHHGVILSEAKDLNPVDLDGLARAAERPPNCHPERSACPELAEGRDLLGRVGSGRPAPNSAGQVPRSPPTVRLPREGSLCTRLTGALSARFPPAPCPLLPAARSSPAVRPLLARSCYPRLTLVGSMCSRYRSLGLSASPSVPVMVARWRRRDSISSW